jgi:hypothetical protein
MEKFIVSVMLGLTLLVWMILLAVLASLGIRREWLS